MQIEDYLKYTGDKITDLKFREANEDSNIIYSVITEFGNSFHWNSETGRILSAKWVVPGSNRIDKLDQYQLDEISGEFYLKSYGEKFKD